MHRVVITGLGSISALGHDVKTFWEALIQGQSGIAPISQVDCQTLRFKQGAEVTCFDAHMHFEAKRMLFLDRFAQFALVAAREAIHNAGLNKEVLASETTAIITGSAMGGKVTEDQSYYRFYHQGKSHAHPFIIPNAMVNAAASQIALEFGITGPTYTVSTACASSTHAIGQAFWLIRQGVVKRAITGGSEAPFSLGQLKAWEGLRIIAQDTCRPFSTGRCGMILGEGAAMLVLESLASAKKRGAPLYGEIVGFGMSADAGHITDPLSMGQQQAISSALKDAGILPNAVQYINAHGTGTLLNDRVEAETIHNIFGDHLKNITISSTKGGHGHLLGATGAIETIATVLALQHQRVPPTVNMIKQDPCCDIPIIAHQAKTHSIEHALCHSFAFGGLNAILVLKRIPSHV
jgi:nodulation protein E